MAPPRHPAKDCPACGKDIGFAAVFFSTHAWSIACPHCQKKLAYKGAVPVTVLIVLAGAGLGWLTWNQAVFFGPGGWGNTLLWVAMWVVALVPLEALATLVMRTVGKLLENKA